MQAAVTLTLGGTGVIILSLYFAIKHDASSSFHPLLLFIFFSSSFSSCSSYSLLLFILSVFSFSPSSSFHRLLFIYSSSPSSSSSFHPLFFFIPDSLPSKKSKKKEKKNLFSSPKRTSSVCVCYFLMNNRSSTKMATAVTEMETLVGA